MVAMTWDPKRYLSFGEQRLRAAVDLLVRVPLESPDLVADLGCGPGNATSLLAERWPQARIVGVDNSPEMIAAARRSGTAAEWIQSDLWDWQPQRRLDLIYANAVLHWLDRHEILLPRLMAFLKPGGMLAVQMPRNLAAPSHTLLRETLASGPWATRVRTVLSREPVGEPGFYYSLLSDWAASIDIWETEYLHVLEGPDAVLNWTRGTALRPVVELLEDDELAEFESLYGERLRAAYPRHPGNGTTLFPFKRLFIVAVAKDAGPSCGGA